MWGAGCDSDPDAASGGDAYRNEASPMALGEWVSDSINYSDGDRTDWKTLLLAAPGEVKLELNADIPDIELRAALVDRYGFVLGTVVRPEGTDGAVELKLKAAAAGRHFVMVQALGGDPSSYSIKLSAGGGAGRPVGPNF
jgi:hypothetical protein